MKTGIHPEYVESTVTCSCGNSFKTGSTVESLHVELCNECHPFYTGKQKLVDSGGRVERFQRRYGKTAFTRAAPPEAGPTTYDSAGDSAGDKADLAAEDDQAEASA